MNRLCPRLLPLLLAATTICGAQSVNPADPRLHRFLTLQNQAQIVMLSEEQLLPKPSLQRLAQALRTLPPPGPNPTTNYLDIEELLIAKLGPEASNLHLGRSRNDLGATSERLILREDTLTALQALSTARERMIALATQHQATIIPGFTHSVQAQPTTFAHYLTAFIAALERDEARLRETYQRLNRSPLGAAAFTTSGFPLNRNRLAALLGFPATVENSYDAIIVSTVDSKAELASAFSLSALSLGRFAQQFVIQYSDSQPGWNLADEAVGHSSIMPQKRNPKPAEQLRILASTVIGDAQTVTLTAHNTPGGEVADFRIHLLQRTSQVAQTAASMYRALDSLVNAIRIDSTRTLSLVENDYSVMTELADTLHREAQLPFRQGHQFAAELASFGRAQRKVPAAISHADANIVYQRLFQKSFPLTEAQFRAALDPRHFVNSRRGDGGPQPASISSLLNNHRQRLDQLNSWLSAERSRLKAAEEVLEQVFRAI